MRYAKSDWALVDIQTNHSHWAMDQLWHLESLTFNKGFALYLTLYKYNGILDGMNRVVATTTSSEANGPYGGEPDLNFNGRSFSKNLSSFIDAVHQMRLSKQDKLP
jgi:hypothetical protein